MIRYVYHRLVIIVAIAIISCESKPTETSSFAEEIPIWEAGLFIQMDNELGEGAIWNDSNREFWHVDIEGKQLFKTNLSTKKQQAYDMGQRIGTVVPDDLGNAIVALQDGVYRFNFDSGRFELITNPLDTIPEIRFNDGKCDARGRLWVGSMGLQQKPNRASLYRIESGTAIAQLDSVTISNGIVWSQDNKTMYYIDTPHENVKAYDFDLENGTISNERVVIEIGGLGFPDGMAIDAEGMLWIALWNGNSVARWNPQTGELIGKVEVPAHNITSCAFVGQQLDSLIITSARVDMNDAERVKYPLAGSLFVVVPGVRGVRSHFYQSN